MSNYAYGIARSLDSLKVYAPELRGELFRWYLDNIDKIIKEETGDLAQSAWCRQTDISEIKKWCKQKGVDR